uniref:Nitrilase homolog 1-like n=1 Tax=Phallusia mammillata TaxID=59560 RepID=A0A6F9DLL7_9ASCI|nr:nitrilase [synthetic construct]CAB3264337.1 nitrilase homolog 1-like [Phallusia mammillata]
MAKSIVAVCQMAVSDDKLENFKQGKLLVCESKRRGAVMTFLPEACDFVASNSPELAEFISSDTSVSSWYCELARSEKIWISLGGIHRKCAGDDQSKCRVSHVIINDVGEITSVYDKCHLFSVDIPGKITLKETDRCVPGSAITDVTETPIGRVASLICYDVRFPQMSCELRRRGAEILTYPSAFTVPTGHAHWHALLRSRAIETQCYVVAAALTGKHGTRSFYGHSLVVDPWGTVLADAGDEVGVSTASVDLGYMQTIRENMPIDLHTRWSLYSDSKTRNEK